MAIENVGTHSFSDCICLLNGFRIDEFHDGGLIFTPDEELFSKYKGSDGSVSRVYNGPMSGMLVLNLKKTALEAQAFLSSILTNDIVTKQNYMTLTLQDPYGGTKLNTTKAWVKGWTPIDWKKELTANAWEIDTGLVETIVIGGNA